MRPREPTSFWRENVIAVVRSTTSFGENVVMARFLKFKAKSTRKLSNFNFQWTKTLYQNNLKNIAFFFAFLKGLTCNKSSLVTRKKISHGSPRKWMSNFTRIVLTQVKFWKFHTEDVVLWYLTFRILGLPWEMFFWCYCRWFITSRGVPGFK